MEIHQRQPRESKRKRFKPWENLRRMFQRKNSTASEHQPASKGQSSSTSRLGGVFGLAGSSRSRSTSELLTTEPQPIPVSVSNSRATVAASSLGAGLSVSHDSVFGLDNSPESDVYSTHNRHQTTGESLPSSASFQYMSELRAAIGGRHRSTEDDEGLPRSPVNATPTTAQVLFVDCSIHSNAVHSGGGSDPSLLSINSCELDEAPFVSLHSRNQQQQQQQQQAQAQQQPGKVLQRAGSNNNNNESIAEGMADDGLLGMAATLNHSAARHKISIRPKRNHAPARPRQLPQLAEVEVGPVEEDSAPTWTSNPSGEDHEERQLPSAPERKNRMGRLMRAEPVSGAYAKQRSVSLNRTEDCAIREVPIQLSVSQADTNNSKPSAGSSSVKLARSKSSVEKKIQHEVAVFWRRTKEGKLFHKKENAEKEIGANVDQDGSKGEQPEIKRKDLRKIKRDKEEKRKRSDASNSKEDSSPPFLSRIFGSRRSSRRQRKKTPTPTPPSPENRTPSPCMATEPMPVPKPRTIFHSPATELDDEEMEIDWRVPHPPYNFAPPPTSRSVPIQSQSRLVDKWAETDVFLRAPPAVASPKISRTEEFLKSSPLPARHHRIHIAGLSPYQRRVARIGNGLEISDDEWDQPEPAISPTRSYHFRPEGRDRSDLSLNLENKSLPVNINQDFILKKASPVQSPNSPLAGENLRRSFEILKFSNEGLKKTIDSLNPKRMSQSSDQLHLSDGSAGQRESCGSISNSTSSLNISDADDTAETNGSMSSLLQSADDEKDVRDDVLIVEDHKEPAQNSNWTEFGEPTVEEPELAPESTPSHADIPDFMQVQLNPRLAVTSSAGSNVVFETEIRSKPLEPEEPVKPKHKSWETRQLAAPLDTPMFSMSVRVQNPPDAKFKRSMSTNDSSPSIPANAEAPPVRKLSESFQPAPRPFIMSVRMSTDNEGTVPAALPAQQLMAKLSARPWQSKEEKERQNKVALGRSQPELELESVKPEEIETPPSADVKLRPKKPAAEETSELLKVFARRSLKVRDSRDLTDVNNFSITVTEASPEARNENLSGSISPGKSATGPDCMTQNDEPVHSEISSSQQQSVMEKMDVSKDKTKKTPKPPVAVRNTVGQEERPAEERPLDRVLKSSGRAPPFFRPGFHESNTDNTIPGARPSVPLFIRLPAEDKSGDSSDKNSKSASSMTNSSSSSQTFSEKIHDEPNNSDTNRIIESTAATVPPPEEVVWKKQFQSKPRPPTAHKFTNKSIDEDVKAATAVAPVRQSKVLDMVHNFQRLQVT